MAMEPDNPPTEPPHDHAQDGWHAQTRAISAGTIARYSRTVSSLKLILPISAACILMILVIVPTVNGSHAQPKKLTSMDAAMVSPTYTSHDAQNRPFEVKAESARQKPDAAGMTDLAHPVAVMDLPNGATLKAQGQGAVYNEKDGSLNVEKGVVLRHSDGTTFTTDEARIDMNAKSAQGNKPVTLQGSFGEIHAQGFKTLEGGKTVIFTGRSTATLKMGGGSSEHEKTNSVLPLSPEQAHHGKPVAPLPHD